jgi:hypothetical protein
MGNVLAHLALGAALLAGLLWLDSIDLSKVSTQAAATPAARRSGRRTVRLASLPPLTPTIPNAKQRLFCRGILDESDDRLVVVNQATDKVLHDEFGILACARGKLVKLGFDLRSKAYFHQPLV